MDREALQHRVLITVSRSSLFRVVEGILEEGKVSSMASSITEYLLNSRYSRERALEHISVYLESELEKSGIDLDDGVDGISLAILFVYEELLENKSEFFSKIQEKSGHALHPPSSDSEE